jgi:hypothetical protein
MRKLIRKLIKESINNTLKESNAVSQQEAYKEALKLLAPIVNDLINENTDSDFLDRWAEATVTADSFDLVPDLDMMIEESIGELFNDMEEYSNDFLTNDCKEMFEEAASRIMSGQNIDPNDYATEITDAYFKEGNEKDVIRVLNRQFEYHTGAINKAISDAAEKKRKAIEAQIQAKNNLEYASNFPIACAGWFVVVDSYGVAIPESCHFQIVFKGGDKVHNVNGADFPLEMNGIELYDIDPKKKSPLIAAYQGKEKVTVPAV